VSAKKSLILLQAGPVLWKIKTQQLYLMMLSDVHSSDDAVFAQSEIQQSRSKWALPTQHMQADLFGPVAFGLSLICYEDDTLLMNR